MKFMLQLHTKTKGKFMLTAEEKSIFSQSETLKVLYVEDNEETRNATKMLFDEYFGVVDTATDDRDGMYKYLDFYKNNNTYYDIVISDISMPKMNGIEMCSKILKINNSQCTLIISAHNESEKLQQLIDIGVTQYIYKPIDNEVFLKTLSKLIKFVFEEKKRIIDIEKLAVNFLKAIPSPVFVINEDIIVYTNKPFEKLLAQKNIDTNKVLHVNSLESIFENKKGYETNIKAIEDGKNFDKKYFYKHLDDKKIFVPVKSEISLPTHDGG